MAEPTPRDTLLDHAYEIADKYGLAALSVRGLASDCNVSVGTHLQSFCFEGRAHHSYHSALFQARVLHRFLPPHER